MQSTKVKYSIVIGAYREEKRLPRTLLELAKYLSEKKLMSETEVVIVVADSNDNTLAVAENSRNSFQNFAVIRPGAQKGKGRDIKEGMLSVVGELRVFMDADLATPLHHLDTVFEKWNKEKFDVLIGVRDLKTIHESKVRRFISLIGNTVFFFVGGFYIKDTQCGFKAFSKEATETCFSKLTRLAWSFDMELLIIAKLQGYKIEQLPILDWQDVPNGIFRGSIRNSLQFFRDLIRIFLNRIQGVYTR